MGRPARFILDHDLYRNPFIGYMADMVYVIPVSVKSSNEVVYKQAFEDIKEALNDGELVMIFPEGEVTHTGEISYFRKGIEKIQKQNPDVPIIPMHMSGLSRGFFGRVGQLFKRNKLPKEFFRKVYLKVGKPLTDKFYSSEELEKIVTNLKEK